MSTTWNFINVGALLLSPVVAVLVTIWIQVHQQTHARKERLFETLMKFRMANPPPRELVDALNLIDVVFKSNDEVRRLWKDYFEMLCRPRTSNPEQDVLRAKYLDLLSAIAKDLGYSRIQQTDIARFYVPQYHEDEFGWSLRFRKELLRVLESTEHLVVKGRDDVATDDRGSGASPLLPPPRKLG